MNRPTSTTMPRPSLEPAAFSDFFAYHGVWAPGIRLFRQTRFTTKSLLVSAAFLLPIIVLLASYLKSVQQTLDFASSERAGVRLLMALQPWQAEVQKQRRLVTSGAAPAVDVPAIEAALDLTRREVAARPGGLDLKPALDQVLESHLALLTALHAGNDAAHGAGALQAYVDAVRSFRNTVLDVSALSLDPEQATYYLMSAAAIVAPDILESVSHSRGLAGAHGGKEMPPEGSRLLYALWHDGHKLIRTLDDQLNRAALAEPGIRQRLPLASALDACDTFFTESERAWFGPVFSASAATLDGPGGAAVDALGRFSNEGVQLLDELLARRMDQATRERNLITAGVAVCLVAALYLFYCFYRVMRGGFDEVERHLRAMTEGDLTTSPRPWGRDEAARLMLTLADMQAALRVIVANVRTASDELVSASHEIASASGDLSHRSEQAAANLQESASTMEQISQGVVQTTDHIRSAAQIAGHGADIATTSGQTIRTVIETMGQVEASSRRIAEIIGLIDGIAFQTNILALNASVEAARAGPQGRGFAVVAAEVHQLAQRSADAARQVKDLIEASGEQVAHGSQIVAQAGEQMEGLLGTVDELKVLMAQVLTSAAEQGSGILLVGQSLQSLDQQTQQNAALVQQTAAAASSLHDQAVSLSSRVARFRLPA